MNRHPSLAETLPSNTLLAINTNNNANDNSASSTAAAQQAQQQGRPQPGSQDDIEECANQYFQQIYASEESARKVVEMLKSFKASGNARENDIFACMIHNLFGEYKSRFGLCFFPFLGLFILIQPRLFFFVSPILHTLY